MTARNDARPLVTLLLTLMALLLLPGPIAAAQNYQGKRFLIVMSYDEETTMEKEIKQALDDLLQGATLQYVWLHAKTHPELNRQEAEEAYRIYQDFKPDVVVAVNDNAQELFVVPYLSNKVATPVVFAGVNDEAGKYGFPSNNVTGVLEKKHYRESISFAQLIEPAIQTVGIIYPDNLSQRKNIDQITEEKASYTARVSEIVQVATVDDFRRALRNLSGRVDAFLIFNPVGIRDQDGNAMQELDLYQIIMEMADKPTIAANEWEIEAGILCGVVKSNSEQASLVVDIINRILGGQPVSEIPITQNRNGRRFLNMVTLKKLGLTLRPQALLGTQLITHSPPVAR